MTPTPAVGPAIKRARERSQMTQRELAKLVGVNVKTVDNWENGRTHPKNRLGALEEVLGPLTEPSRDPVSISPDEDPYEARIRAIRGIEELPDDEKEILIGYLRAKRAAAVAEAEARRRGA